MATRNRLTDSGQNVRKGTAAQLGVKASKRRAASELSTKDMQWEQKVAKGPSVAAKVDRDPAKANLNARRAVSKPKRITNDLSTKMERLEKKNIKGPSNLVHMNRDPQQANMNARFAAYKEETKREELRTANRHKWSDASPASESRAEKNPKQFDTLVKHKRNPGRANMVASRAVRKSRLANDFAASELPNIVKKRQTGAKKTVNRGLEAGVAKRVGAMMPKSTGPAKKSTRSRKTSK